MRLITVTVNKPESQNVRENAIFSERELTFTFDICYRPSICRLSVCRL